MSPSMREWMLRSKSDEQLAALAAGGNERAFGALLERHRPALLGLARKTVGASRAEDALQQSLMDAWCSLRAGTEVTHVRAWLFQIVRHACWKAAGERTSGELPLTLVGAESPHASVAQRTQLRAVVDELGRLPHHQRVALVETAVEGRSAAEVATRIGVSEVTARQLVYRARARLRQAAAALLPTPLVNWIARRGHEQRVGELTGGGITLAGAAKVAAGVLAVGAAAIGAHVGLGHLAPPASAKANGATALQADQPARPRTANSHPGVLDHATHTTAGGSRPSSSRVRPGGHLSSESPTSSGEPSTAVLTTGSSTAASGGQPSARISSHGGAPPGSGPLSEPPAPGTGASEPGASGDESHSSGESGSSGGMSQSPEGDQSHESPSTGESPSSGNGESSPETTAAPSSEGSSSPGAG